MFCETIAIKYHPIVIQTPRKTWFGYYLIDDILYRLGLGSAGSKSRAGIALNKFLVVNNIEFVKLYPADPCSNCGLPNTYYYRTDRQQITCNNCYYSLRELIE